MATRQKPGRLHTRSIISVTFRPDDGRKVVRAARSVGKPMTAFIRDVTLAEVDRVLSPKLRKIR